MFETYVVKLKVRYIFPEFTVPLLNYTMVFVTKCPACGATLTLGFFVNLFWQMKCINQKFNKKQNLFFFIFLDFVKKCVPVVLSTIHKYIIKW